MEDINVGIANLIISEKLKNSYFNDSLIEESKKITHDFLEVLRNSPILQLEFKVFNNIENKHIENDVSATRYIDNNIKLFEIFTINEINKEHEQFLPFIDENINDGIETKYQKKINLYNAIFSLIKESITDYNNVDVNEMHNSFSHVLNHIKTPKKKNTEINSENNVINENVIEIAVDKFNEKYENLDENDRNLFQILTILDGDGKVDLFETYKKDTLDTLEKVKESENNTSITAAINKIEKMVYETYEPKVIDDIISLYELKKGLV